MSSRSRYCLHCFLLRDFFSRSSIFAWDCWLLETYLQYSSVARSNLNKANSSFSKIKTTSEKSFGLFNKSTTQLVHRVRLARYSFRLCAVLESSLRQNVYSKFFTSAEFVSQLKRFFQVSRFWLFKRMLSDLLIPWIDIMKQYSMKI